MYIDCLGRDGSGLSSALDFLISGDMEVLRGGGEGGEKLVAIGGSGEVRPHPNSITAWRRKRRMSEREGGGRGEEDGGGERGGRGGENGG